MKAKLEHTLPFGLIVLAFTVLVAPLALNFGFYYPDEVHYHDAAIKMLQSGDWLTPYTGGGELRFNKPILTYWFVAAGYQLFGINTFGARVLFLLAGIAVILLAYATSKLLTNNKTTAYLTALITISNVTFIMSTLRSIPDVLLCLFISLSVLGFAGILKYGNNTPKKYLWMLYMGMALAIEVKGVPAIIIGTTAFFFLLFNPRKRIPIKKLIHFPSFITAIVVALSWFVLMYQRHNNLFLSSFYNDQVGERVSLSVITLVKNTGLSVVLIVALLMPWLTFISPGILQQKRSSQPEQAFQRFVAIASLVFIILSVTVFKFYDRYLLPLLPIWSIWLASVISTTVFQKRKVATWGIVAFVLNITLLLFSVLTNLNLNPGIWHLGWILTGTGITVYLFSNLFKTKQPLWLALSVPLLAFNLASITSILSTPTEGQQLERILDSSNIKPSIEIGYLGKAEIASKLRIASKGEYQIVNLDEISSFTKTNSYSVLIIAEERLDTIDTENYTIIGKATGWSDPESNQLLVSLIKGNYQKELEKSGSKYLVLKANNDL